MLSAGAHRGDAVAGSQVVFGPPRPAVWSPRTTVRFSDAHVACADAVRARATERTLLGRLPEPVLFDILAFAIVLFNF